MKRLINKETIKPYLIITLVYILAHFFILLLSGCWWDDWTFMTHDLNYISIVASQSGRPEWNLLIPFCWSQPNNGRILIFFLYLLDALFVYAAIKNCGLFDERESLIIGLLFAVAPVDDARILISNFSYTVGLFFFFLSLMLFMFWNRMDKSAKKTIFRICLLVLFFISFILNSVLAYYYILIGYLFVLELKDSKEQNIVKKALSAVKNVLVKYPDFFVLPFIYYGINKTFFPTYGDAFDDYNAVTISGTLKCFLYIPLSVIKTFKDIILKSISCINIYTAIILALSVFVCIFIRSKDDDGEINIKDSLVKLLYGLFILAMGLLPYVMVRGKRIDTMGVKGRDAVLLPLGIAIILFSVVSLFKGKLRKVFITVFVVFGIFSLNSLYLEWQKDYYYQLSMENLFNNKIIAENDTFFLIDLTESDIEGQRYYSINTNAYHVFGDETRFFMPKVSNLYILKNRESVRKTIEWLGYSGMMRDYDPEDLCFDAILNYANELSWQDVIRLKYLEMTNNKEFMEEIDSKGELEITIVDDDFTAMALKEYDEGKLHEDEDLLNLLIEYSE